MIRLGMLRSRFSGSHDRSIFNLLTRLCITVYHNDFYSACNFLHYTRESIKFYSEKLFSKTISKNKSF